MQTSQGIRSIFTGENIVATTNYIYTSGELDGANDGWERCDVDHVALQFQCATLNAATAYVSLEGRFGTGYKAAEVTTFTISGAQTIASLYNIDERLLYYRVDVKVNDATASPNNFYAYLHTVEDK